MTATSIRLRIQDSPMNVLPATPDTDVVVAVLPAGRYTLTTDASGNVLVTRLASTTADETRVASGPTTAADMQRANRLHYDR